MRDKFGTPYYIAPEVLKKNYTEKCDIWSMGIILFILLCGYPPFTGHTDEKILQSVLKGRHSLEGEEWDVISEDGKRIVEKMLTYDPELRPSAEELLRDKWFEKTIVNEKLDTPISLLVLENMKKFKSNQKLQQAALSFIASRLATSEEKNELLKTFQTLDRNGDGMLSRDEIYEGYKQMLGETKAAEEAVIYLFLFIYFFISFILSFLVIYLFLSFI